MDYQKFLVLFLSLLVFPIVKADGCGLVCPKHPDNLMSLTLVIICQFATWSLCHIFSFFIVLIGVILTYIFWRGQSENKKKRVMMFVYGLIGIFFIVLLYPYIRAWVYTSPSIPIPPIPKCSSCSDTGGITPNGVCGIMHTMDSKDNQSSASQQYYSIECWGTGYVEILSSNPSAWNICYIDDVEKKETCPIPTEELYVCSPQVYSAMLVYSNEIYYIMMNNTDGHPENNPFTINMTCSGG
jgi:hypothetical protein